MSQLFNKILARVRTNRVAQPFKPSNFSFLSNSPSFLSKHCIGNPGEYTPYFIRVSRGNYRINPVYIRQDNFCVDRFFSHTNLSLFILYKVTYRAKAAVRGSDCSGNLLHPPIWCGAGIAAPQKLRDKLQERC